MSEIQRDTVHNYRPGPDSEQPLDEGEVVQAEFLADRRRYWYDHAVLGGIGAVLVAVVLIWMGKTDQIGIAIAAVALGMLARAAYFRSEAFARRWRLTQKRLIGPQGRAVMLLEIKAVRRLMGDVQIVTKMGDKHLIKHLADAEAVVQTLEAARARRAKAVQ
ncbi:MAG: hypothetical protein IE922_07400 [Sphingomonadales bacterium]|nr:hypothetical protein [Sphingomonadales bacterium]